MRRMRPQAHHCCGVRTWGEKLQEVVPWLRWGVGLGVPLKAMTSQTATPFIRCVSPLASPYNNNNHSIFDHGERIDHLKPMWFLSPSLTLYYCPSSIPTKTHLRVHTPAANVRYLQHQDTHYILHNPTIGVVQSFNCTKFPSRLCSHHWMTSIHLWVSHRLSKTWMPLSGCEGIVQVL